MIRPIRHKGLKRLYEDDDPRGVIAEHVLKLRDILARLDAARTRGRYGHAWLPAASAQRRIQGLLGGNGSCKLAGDFPLCRPRRLVMSITWITTERRLTMPMKNPPHPGGFVLRQCIEPLGLSITARRRRSRSDAHDAIGTGERKARHISRNGRQAVQGVWWQRRKLACATGAVSSWPTFAPTG